MKKNIFTLTLLSLILITLLLTPILSLSTTIEKPTGKILLYKEITYTGTGKTISLYEDHVFIVSNTKIYETTISYAGQAYMYPVRSSFINTIEIQYFPQNSSIILTTGFMTLFPSSTLDIFSLIFLGVVLSSSQSYENTYIYPSLFIAYPMRLINDLPKLNKLNIIAYGKFSTETSAPAKPRKISWTVDLSSLKEKHIITIAPTVYDGIKAIKIEMSYKTPKATLYLTSIIGLNGFLLVRKGLSSVIKLVAEDDIAKIKMPSQTASTTTTSTGTTASSSSSQQTITGKVSASSSTVQPGAATSSSVVAQSTTSGVERSSSPGSSSSRIMSSTHSTQQTVSSSYAGLSLPLIIAAVVVVGIILAFVIIRRH